VLRIKFSAGRQFSASKSPTSCSTQTVAESSSNIGIVYSREGNLVEALRFFFIALKLSEEIGDIESVAGASVNIGNVYITQKTTVAQKSI